MSPTSARVWRAMRAINATQKSATRHSLVMSLRTKHLYRCQANPCEKTSAPKRIHGAFLGHVCVWMDRSNIMRRATGLEYRRIFRPRRPARDALTTNFGKGLAGYYSVGGDAKYIEVQPVATVLIRFLLFSWEYKKIWTQICAHEHQYFWFVKYLNVVLLCFKKS
jgi:hypothetical protein